MWKLGVRRLLSRDLDWKCMKSIERYFRPEVFDRDGKMECGRDFNGMRMSKIPTIFAFGVTD
jgi:hypothetical protein